MFSMTLYLAVYTMCAVPVLRPNHQPMRRRISILDLSIYCHKRFALAQKSQGIDRVNMATACDNLFISGHNLILDTQL